MDNEDINELKLLLSQATRPAVKAFLEKEIANAGPAAGAPPAVATPAVAPAAAPIPVASSSSTGAGSGSSTHVTFESIQKGWGWEQNKDDIEVMIFEGLEGIGALPKENTTVEFFKQGFDVKVVGLNGKNKRLLVDNLEKEIDVPKCSFKVTKNRIKLILKKMAPYNWPEHWGDLLAKKKKAPKDSAATHAAASDPSEGIMSVMKELYEDGDDQTRKIIAEAWTKSRASAGKGKGSDGFGDLGDIGGASSSLGDGIDDL